MFKNTLIDLFKANSSLHLDTFSFGFTKNKLKVTMRQSKTNRTGLSHGSRLTFQFRIERQKKRCQIESLSLLLFVLVCTYVWYIDWRFIVFVLKEFNLWHFNRLSKLINKLFFLAFGFQNISPIPCNQPSVNTAKRMNQCLNAWLVGWLDFYSLHFLCVFLFFFFNFCW